MLWSPRSKQEQGSERQREAVPWSGDEGVF